MTKYRPMFFLMLMLWSSAVAAQTTQAFSGDPNLADRARQVNLGEEFILEGLDLAVPGQPLILKRFQVWAPNARVLIHDGETTAEMAPPNNLYFGGTMDGDPLSRAYLAVMEDGEIHGLVSQDGRYWMLAQSGSQLIAAELDRSLTEIPADFLCDSDALASPPVLDQAPKTASIPERTQQLGGSGTYTATIAAETDFEFFQLFGNSTDATNYIADLIAYNSTIYSAEVDTNLALGDVFIRTTSSDPWTATSSLCALYQFGGYWNTNNTGITRTIAHMFSGKNTGGGIAWVGVLCNSGFSANTGACGFSPQTGSYGGGYGFTGSLSGNFDINNPAVIWDIVATGHEIGHNFNSPHTHCYANIGGSSSPIDQCYGSEGGCYSGATSLPCGTVGGGCGTMMSYCHLLSGGMNNISFTFGQGHPHGVQPERVPTRMNAHVVSVAGSSPSCITTACTGPSITSQPSSATKCPTESVTFSVTATSATGYQWQKGGVNIDGATSSSYNIASVTSGDAGTYTCIVSNACDSVTSNQVTLTVNTTTQITSQSSNLTRCSGTSATFQVAASGTNVTYQWRKGGNAINGATSATYTINSVSLSDEGAYSCFVSGTCGNVTSSDITLDVYDSIVISADPSDQTGCVGDDLSLSVTASGGAVSLAYQWYLGGQVLSGATSASLSLMDVDSGDAGTYFCRVTDSCGSEDSASATVTVRDPIAISQGPSSATRCIGDPVTFSVTATGTNPTYQWKKNSSDIGGATSSSYSIASVQAGDAASYTCLVTNSCNSQLSSGATLTVTNASFSVSGASSAPIQGLTPITLTADVICGGSGTVEWINTNTGASLGLNVNPVTLSDPLEETTVFQVRASNGVTTLTDEVTVFAPQTTTFLDLNGDGCNDIEDLYTLAAQWGVSTLDANGDGVLNILDFQFVNLSGTCQ